MSGPGGRGAQLSLIRRQQRDDTDGRKDCFSEGPKENHSQGRQNEEPSGAGTQTAVPAGDTDHNEKVPIKALTLGWGTVWGGVLAHMSSVPRAAKKKEKICRFVN